MKYFAFTALIVLMLLLAMPVLAQVTQTNLPEGLVPCDGVSADAGSWTCGKKEFFQLIENILNFCIFYLAVPLATVAIAYAGINMAVHPDNPGTIKEGKDIIMSVVIGLVFVLGAWLLVTTIMGYLLEDNLLQNVRGNTSASGGP